MGVAGRRAAAKTLERRIHVYLEQPKLLFDPMKTGRGINSCGDGDDQGASFGPGPEAGWFHFYPSKKI